MKDFLHLALRVRPQSARTVVKASPHEQVNIFIDDTQERSIVTLKTSGRCQTSYL